MHMCHMLHDNLMCMLLTSYALSINFTALFAALYSMYMHAGIYVYENRWKIIESGTTGGKQSEPHAPACSTYTKINAMIEACN